MNRFIDYILRRLRQKANTPQLSELTNYIYQTWIINSMWKPNCWSVYNQLVRTNNDVEGWHSSLNRAAARSNLEFYLLVELLSREVNWRPFNLFYLYIAHNIIVSILRLNWLISN